MQKTNEIFTRDTLTLISHIHSQSNRPVLEDITVSPFEFIVLPALSSLFAESEGPGVIIIY